MDKNREIENICILIKKIYKNTNNNLELAEKYLFDENDRNRVIYILKEIQDISRELRKIGESKISSINNSIHIDTKNTKILNIVEIERKKFDNFISLIENVIKIINDNMIRHKIEESYLYSGNNFIRNNLFELDIVDENELFTEVNKKMSDLSVWIFDKLGNKEDPVGIIAGDETSSLYQVYFKVKYLSKINSFDEVNEIKNKINNALRDVKTQSEIYIGKKGQNKYIFDFCIHIFNNLSEIDYKINNFLKQKEYNYFIDNLISIFSDKNEEAYKLKAYFATNNEIDVFIKRIIVSNEQKFLLQQFMKSSFLGKNNFCGIKIDVLKNWVWKEEIKVVDHNKLKVLIEYLKPYLGSYSKNIKDIPDFVNKTLYVLQNKDELNKKNLTIAIDNLFGEIFDTLWLEEYFFEEETNIIFCLKKISEDLKYPLSNIQRDRREVLFYSFVKYCLFISTNKFNSSHEINDLLKNENDKKFLIQELEEKENEIKVSTNKLLLTLRNKKKELTELLLSIEYAIKENAKGKKDIPYNLKKIIPIIQKEEAIINVDKIEEKKDEYKSKLSQTFISNPQIQAEIQKALKEAERLRIENEKNNF